MKYTRRFIISILIVSLVVMVSAQTTPSISVKDASSYIGRTVAVKGTVLRVGHSSSNVYFLNFTSEKGGFTATISGEKYKDLLNAGIDINSIEGKTVTVTGQIFNDSKYGLEMQLADPSKQLVLPETATEVKYASEIISVDNVPKYVGQYATVQGKVLKVDVSKTGTTFFLRFTSQQNGFTVVIFPSVITLLKKANVDVKLYAGKTVQVNGNIKYYEQYGYEILLDNPDHIKEVKQ